MRQSKQSYEHLREFSSEKNKELGNRLKMVQQSQFLLNNIVEKDVKTYSTKSNQNSPRVYDVAVSSSEKKQTQLRNYKSHEKLQSNIINNFFNSKLEECKVEWDLKN